MGVYFDYFRAENDDDAIGTRSRPGGPLADSAAAPFDGFATKGVFPDPHLEQLVAHALRVSYERRPPTTRGLWPPPDTPPPTDETSLWLTDPSIERLVTRIRDVLADIPSEDIARLGEAWADDVSHPVDEAVRTVAGLTALARRARDTGQELYCWSSL